MRDINQKPSDTDKRIAIALRRSVWLTYLLTLGTISTGGLSIFGVATILSTPAQASETEQATNLPTKTVEELPNLVNSDSNQAAIFEEHQALANKPSKTAETELQASQKLAQPEPEVLAQASTANETELQASQNLNQASTANETELQASQNLNQEPEPAVLAQPSTAKLPVFTAQNQSPATEFKFAPGAVVPVMDTVESNVPQLAVSDKPAAVWSAFTPPPTENTATTKSVERNTPQITLEPEPTQAISTQAPATNVYKGPGSAALLGGTLQAQSLRDTPQQTPSRLENAPQSIDPLAPTLVFQGVVINQGDTSARARLSGFYPISPNAMFGGTAEVGTGPDFSDPQAGSFRINELYFTGNLPSYPNLRLTAGLVDLTSYFDRNSFAKDAATQFFNPVFQTNPALSATGIGSRPAVLLNWNVSDNIEAKAAGFSSAQSIGDIALDAFAGELGYRVGNGIIRATYATGRDVERNGFKEIYGINRGPGETGPRSSDRESSYGINGEYFFPEIKMGVFGRYGRYENTSIDRGGDTYSVGLNFLDLFTRDDRLGFGYGRNLSNDDLRRQTGAKVPDVWEIFYDMRISPILRAAVTLQERNQFTETVVGFRLKTEFDVTSLLGRVFR
jgi:hypothetical protein